MAKMKRERNQPGDQGGLKHHPDIEEAEISVSQRQEAENASPDDFDDGIGEPGHTMEPGERRDDKDEG